MRRSVSAGIACGLMVLLLAGAAPASAAETPSAWGMTELTQALAQTRQAEADFTERKRSTLLTTELVTSGTLSFRAPDQLEKHVRKPFEERVVVHGDAITIERPAEGLRRQLSMETYPAVHVLVESLRATLAGDLASLERHYRLNLWGEARAWRLRLVPRDDAVLKYIESITFQGAHGRVATIETREAGGDTSLMTITTRAARAAER